MLGAVHALHVVLAIDTPIHFVLTVDQPHPSLLKVVFFAVDLEARLPEVEAEPRKFGC